MVYVPSKPPAVSGADGQALAAYLDDEMKSVAAGLRDTDLILFSVTHKAPAKPREGMYAFADGTNWNPGDGEGPYFYNGTTWKRAFDIPVVVPCPPPDVDVVYIPSGSVMLFQQTAAPTGWTKLTTHNDKALRVVSGTASSGGSNAFSTVMAQTVVGSTTISTSSMPGHSHAFNIGTTCGASTGAWGGTQGIVSAVNTTSVGSGGSHNHSITMNMQYVDIILASKD